MDGREDTLGQINPMALPAGYLAEYAGLHKLVDVTANKVAHQAQRDRQLVDEFQTFLESADIVGRLRRVGGSRLARRVQFEQVEVSWFSLGRLLPQCPRDTGLKAGGGNR